MSIVPIVSFIKVDDIILGVPCQQQLTRRCNLLNGTMDQSLFSPSQIYAAMMTMCSASTLAEAGKSIRALLNLILRDSTRCKEERFLCYISVNLQTLVEVRSDGSQILDPQRIHLPKRKFMLKHIEHNLGTWKIVIASENYSGDATVIGDIQRVMKCFQWDPFEKYP